MANTIAVRRKRLLDRARPEPSFGHKAMHKVVMVDMVMMKFLFRTREDIAIYFRKWLMKLRLLNKFYLIKKFLR